MWSSGLIPGSNPFAIGTSPAGKRINDAGLAYQASHPEFTQKQKPVEVTPLAPPAAVALVSPPGDRTYSGPCTQIIAEVAEKYGLTAALIVSPKRNKTIIPARFEAIYRCVVETDKGLGYIARVFHRDRTTVGATVMRYCRINGLTPPRGLNWKAGSERDHRLRKRRLRETRRAA